MGDATAEPATEGLATGARTADATAAPAMEVRTVDPPMAVPPTADPEMGEPVTEAPPTAAAVTAGCPTAAAPTAEVTAGAMEGPTAGAMAAPPTEEQTTVAAPTTTAEAAVEAGRWRRRMHLLRRRVHHAGWEQLHRHQGGARRPEHRGHRALPRHSRLGPRAGLQRGRCIARAGPAHDARSRDAGADSLRHRADIYSGMCNTTPGDEGVIRKVKLYVNDDTVGIPIDVEASKRDGNLAAPYFYEGYFSEEIPPLEPRAKLPRPARGPSSGSRLSTASRPAGPRRLQDRPSMLRKAMRTARRPILRRSLQSRGPTTGWTPRTRRSSGSPDRPALLDKDDFRIRMLDGLRRIVKRDGQYYVATRDGDCPDVMLLLATQLDDGWITETDPPPD